MLTCLWQCHCTSLPKGKRGYEWERLLLSYFNILTHFPPRKIQLDYMDCNLIIKASTGINVTVFFFLKRATWLFKICHKFENRHLKLEAIYSKGSTKTTQLLLCSTVQDRCFTVYWQHPYQITTIFTKPAFYISSAKYVSECINHNFALATQKRSFWKKSNTAT